MSDSMSAPSAHTRLRTMAVAVMASLALVAGLLSPAQAGHQFTDVPNDHPFHDEISWAADNGIVTGFDDGTFRPTLDITRMAVAAMTYRFGGEPDFDPPDEGDESFSDVPSTHFFYLEIEWLASTGITTGWPDGTFRPSNPTTRMATAAFFYRIAGEPDFDPPATPTFPDVPPTHAFFLEIEWLHSTGITTGYDDGTFRPGDNVKRMAMAAFFQRADEVLPGTVVADWDVMLSWINEVDDSGAEPVFGQGEENATGTAHLVVAEFFDGSHELTFEIDASEVTPPFCDGPGAHLHEGPFDENGPVRVFFGTCDDLDDNEGLLSGTLTDDDFSGGVTIQDVLDDPENFYVNVHSDDFPAGAIRGQLPDGGQDQIPDE